MPTYNEADVIAARLDNIIEQGYPNLEILVVDSASTDGTAEAVRKWASGHPQARLKLIEEPERSLQLCFLPLNTLMPRPLGTGRIKVALVSSRGIPPRYGGAETFVYVLSKMLLELWSDLFEPIVTCEGDRFGVDEYEGVKRVHVWAKHTPTMTIPVIYDVLATLYLLWKVRDVDVIYYVAPDGALAALIAKLARKKVLVNTDGVEWLRLFRRMKFVSWRSKPLYLATALLMLLMEALASKVADVVVADAIGIKMHLKRLWKPKRIEYIAYGVRVLPPISESEERAILEKYGLKPYGYYLTIGRIVAENGIHVEIKAFKMTNSRKKLVIVGPIDTRDPYVKHVLKLKAGDKRIVFLGGIYDLRELYALRKNCFAYIHAYEVGGTNPSLLEQLQFDRPIIARDVIFHREILRERGLYFRSEKDLAEVIEKLEREETNGEALKIRWVVDTRFTWSYITYKYATLFCELSKSPKSVRHDVPH